MKALSATLVTLFVVLLLFAVKLSNKVTSEARTTGGTAQTGLPSFLEKGKTYQFAFVVSTGGEYGTSAVSITGRVEKFDAMSTWVYINHYVTTRKGKALESKFEGYSWININQVFQCSEVTIKP